MGVLVKPAALTDEEWAIQLLINESAHECAYCGEDIHSVEELQLLQVVYANRVNGKLEFYAIEDERGEYLYKSKFFHFMCWEEVQEGLAEITEDQEPPICDEIERRACECDSCTADIRHWETTGMVQFGELRRAKRMPNGDSTLYFDECNTAPRTFCISCLRTINHEVLEMWPEISHAGECAEGTLYRCWRDGGCRHGCRRLDAAE